MNVVKKLEKILPVEIQYGQWGDDLNAWYCWDLNKTGLKPKCHIKIDGRYDKWEKIAALAHEIGHAVHHEQIGLNNPYEGGWESELFANKFAFSFLLKNKQKKAMYFLIKVVEKEATLGELVNLMGHVTAANKIKEEEIYKKCIDFIGKRKYNEIMKETKK